MRKIVYFFTMAVVVAMFFTACNSGQGHLERAEQMRTTIYELYDVDQTALLAENYPQNTRDQVTYLANGLPDFPNQYSYLWPYSGTISMMSALYEANRLDDCLKFIDNHVLVGLESYFDKSREPYAYSSYITVGSSDRFYDDNIWLAIDFVDLYKSSGQQRYLDKAVEIWKFVMSGYDEKLHGGIYWCEQTKETKNCCSTAPAAVCALKLYEATGDRSYMGVGMKLFQWAQGWLFDEAEGLYNDNVNVSDYKTNKAKYSYNTGQMIQAGAMLYRLTQQDVYLKHAQYCAERAYERWFKEIAGKRMLESGDVWFDAVLLRGLIELYNVDGNRTYLDAVDHTLEYAWKHGRDEQGLFGKYLSHQEEGKPKRWLLTQAAYVEMSARMALLEK